MDCEEGGLEIPGRVAGAGTSGNIWPEKKYSIHPGCGVNTFEAELTITDYMEKKHSPIRS